MKTYIKKPVEIQAEQWLGTVIQYNDLLSANIINKELHEDGSCDIETLEGTMKCNLNDYIIKGIKGEFYPCKPDIFELTYKLVTE
jgi:hypothetical protein